MSPKDEEALQDFAASYDERSKISDYLRASDGSVKPGSVLAQDDELFSHNPTSQIVWVAMISASEHLDVIDALLKLAPQRTFVTAPFTTVRGALVGAAQALSILGPPDRVERQQRSLSIAIEYLTQLIGYQRDQLSLCNEGEAKLVQEQIDSVYQPSLDEAIAKRKKGYRYTDTQLISTAVDYRFSENVDNIRRTLDLHWRRLGGDAHVLGWPLLFGDLTWSGGDPSQLSPVIVSGSVAGVVETASWAFQFLRKAIELHQQMSV